MNHWEERGPSGWRLGLSIALLLAIGLLGCSRTNDSQLSNASDTPETAVQRMLDALAVSDTVAMHSLRMSRYEHDSILVPQMPIGQADSGSTDLGYAWFLLEQNNIKGIRRAISDYGGQRFRVTKVRFTRPDQRYGSVTLHKGTEVSVRDSGGQESVLPIFGSIIEQGGRFKIVSVRD